MCSRGWYLVLWPRGDGEVSAFMRWLTMTHAQRWHAHRHSAGAGHLYQGRFRCFAAQHDHHYLRTCRYVERNALRANLVARAQDCWWCSLWRREFGDAAARQLPCDGPVQRPGDWPAWVNEPETSEELEALRRASKRGCSFGDEAWTRTAARGGIRATPARPPAEG